MNEPEKILLPIACTLTDAELRERRNTLLAGVVERTTAIDENDSGFTLRYAPADETLEMLFTLVRLERACCPFLRFEIAVAENNGPVTLTISGPAGTREFVKEIFSIGTP